VRFGWGVATGPHFQGVISYRCSSYQAVAWGDNLVWVVKLLLLLLPAAGLPGGKKHGTLTTDTPLHLALVLLASASISMTHQGPAAHPPPWPEAAAAAAVAAGWAGGAPRTLKLPELLLPLLLLLLLPRSLVPPAAVGSLSAAHPG
jgi:hypothetical protein